MRAEERRLAKAARANSKSKDKSVSSPRSSKAKTSVLKSCALCGEEAALETGIECAGVECPAFVGDCFELEMVTCADDAEVTGDHEHCSAVFCTPECFEAHMQ
jgi:hypothetical protein